MSFPPCYSQSSLQFCPENSFYFFQLTQPLIGFVQEKGGKPDRKPHPLPYGLRYSIQKPENSHDYAQKPQ